MSDATEFRLSLAEGVPLVHAMVSRVAHDAGIRALLIKGPILAMQGLRRPRQSGDVDVLCDPPSAHELGRTLANLGWTATEEHPEKPKVLEPLGNNWIHPRWPCNIDLHHRFLGFYAPPQVVFDAFWERRAQVQIASQPVICPHPLDSAMIHGLHLLSGPELVFTETDLDDLVRFLKESLTADQKRALAERAASLRAADTLAPVLERAGFPRLGRNHLAGADAADWRLRRLASETKGVVWLEELRSAGSRGWFRLVVRALTFDEKTTLHAEQHRRPFDRASLIARRLAAAIRYLPRAIRVLLRARDE